LREDGSSRCWCRVLAFRKQKYIRGSKCYAMLNEM
jgi:hypothetical protein